MLVDMGDRIKKQYYRSAVCLLLAIFISVQGSMLSIGNVSAGEESVANSGKTANLSDELITVNMVNADVRDILSTIAISMDASIIYLGVPIRVSFNARDVTPEKALELLIQTISAAGSQLGYIKDGKVIIIGSHENLQKEFFNQMALTRFKVTYMSPIVLGEQLEKLGIPAVKITLDESSSFIWVQGAPQALSKVASVIAALDRRENFEMADGGMKSAISLKPVTLRYITAEVLKDLIRQLKIEAQPILLDTNPNVLWVNGSQQALLDINQLAALIDIPQSASPSFEMSYIKTKNVTYSKLIPIAEQLESPVEIIRVGSGQKSLWLKGEKKDISELAALIAKLDISDNADEVQFFTYSLRNISPADAQTRLQFLAVSGVEVMTLNYSQLASEILIKCPYDMIGAVTRILANIDIQGQKVKAPVDYASSAYQLTKRKELLSRMMNIPAESLIISDNVARDGAESYYVIWVEDTPDNIKKIKEMVKLIDEP